MHFRKISHLFEKVFDIWRKGKGNWVEKNVLNFQTKERSCVWTFKSLHLSFPFLTLPVRLYEIDIGNQIFKIFTLSSPKSRRQIISRKFRQNVLYSPYCCKYYVYKPYILFIITVPLFATYTTGTL